MNQSELNKRIEELVEKANDPDIPRTRAETFAAKAETFQRIKEDNLMFGSPRESLEKRKSLPKDEYAGHMSAARISALEEYLNTDE